MLLVCDVHNLRLEGSRRRCSVGIYDEGVVSWWDGGVNATRESIDIACSVSHSVTVQLKGE